jgi:membrane protein DedA with SNARE-associated domain
MSSLIQLLLSAKGTHIYIILATLLLAGALGLPVPEDLPLIYAGKLIFNGTTQFFLTFLICYVAILLGDTVLFWIGYWGGSRVIESRRFRKRFNPRHIKRIENSINKHSFKLILIGRHLFYLRSLTFLMCGAMKVSYLRFIAIDALAAAISVPLTLSLGYYFAEYIDLLIIGINELKVYLLIAGVLALTYYLFFKFKVKPNRKKWYRK